MLTNTPTSSQEINANEENLSFDEKKKLYWTQNIREVVIPSFKRKSFDKLLKKLIRFSTTIGFPTPTITEKGNRFEYVVTTKTIGGKPQQVLATWDKEEALLKKSKYSRNPTKMASIHTREYEVVDLNIVDEVRPIEDWDLLGTINYNDGVVNPAPGKEVPMDILQDINLTGKSDCDHCNKTIKRNKTVFVQNSDNGEIKQIGGTCTKYYLGMDYQKVIGYIESLTVILEPISDEDWSGHSAFEEETCSVTDAIKYYIWWVNTHNTHISKKSAQAYNDQLDREDENYHRKMRTPTGQIVSNEVEFISNPPSSIGLGDRAYNELMELWSESGIKFENDIKTVSDEELQEVLDFISSKKAESNFMFNVSNKVEEGIIPCKMLKFIVGGCSFFFGVKMAEKAKLEREEGRKKANDEKVQNSSHIGTVGEKTSFQNIEIKRIGGFESDFGWTNVFTMEDETGNVFTKFGKIGDKFIVSDNGSVEVGTKLSFTADVKSHKEFNGVAQTVLGRLSKFNPKLTY